MFLRQTTHDFNRLEKREGGQVSSATRADLARFRWEHEENTERNLDDEINDKAQTENDESKN